jgi:hypothetical protein
MQCFHCGRDVRETTHRQKSYKVDYYLLHTGYTEPAFFINTKLDAPPYRYLKLIQAVDIITCVECYARPQIREQLEEDFNNVRSLLQAPARAKQVAELKPKG